VSQVRYETKTVKVLRGTESRSISKWEAQGWELVTQDTGTARSTLTFRKAKRPVPVKALAIGGAAVLLVAGVITGSLLIFGGGDPDTAAASTSAAATSSSAEATPTAVSPPPPPVTASAPNDSAGQSGGSTAPITQIGVDDLFNALNAPSTSGIATGDRFQITGPLSGSDYWGESVNGEFFVYMSALGGANDLTILIDEDQTRAWADGTVVTFVVEVVDKTYQGETSSGWLQAQSAQVA
jgi:hypothetical protein